MNYLNRSDCLEIHDVDDFLKFQILMDLVMERTWLQIVFVWFSVYFIINSALIAADINRLNIWPMPKSVSHGHQLLYFSNNFEPKTEGSKYADASWILKDAFTRTVDTIKLDHVIEAKVSHYDPSLVLKGIHMVIFSPSDEVQTVYGALHGLQVSRVLPHIMIHYLRI